MTVNEQEAKLQEMSTEELEAILTPHLPIDTVRVSSASASGRAKQYVYWGMAKYQVRRGRNGKLINACVSGASSDRRSRVLAIQDAQEYAARHHAALLDTIGTINRYDMWVLVRHVLGM